MTKINVTDNATCSTINDMDIDMASYVVADMTSDVAADMASDMAADVASYVADDVAFLEKPSPLVRGFILKLGH